MATSCEYSTRRRPPGVELQAAGKPREPAGEHADEDHAEPESGIDYSASELCPIAVSRAFPRTGAAMPRRVPMIIESTVAARAGAACSGSRAELVDDGPLARVRRPEVSVEEVPQVTAELGEQALVLAAFVDDRLAHGRGEAAAVRSSGDHRACERGRS